MVGGANGIDDESMAIHLKSNHRTVSVVYCPVLLLMVQLG